MDLNRDIVMGHEFCAELVDFGSDTRRGIKPGTRLRFTTDGKKLVAVKETVEDPVSAVFGSAGRLKTDAVMARLRPSKP